MKAFLLRYMEPSKKRLSSESSGWSKDVIVLVLSFVPFIERMRLRAVSRLWRRCIENSTRELPPSLNLNDQLLLSLRRCPLTRLESSQLSRCSAQAMRFVRAMPLRHLGLPVSMSLSEEVLDNLRFLTRLESLQIPRVEPSDFTFLARLTTLKHLNVDVAEESNFALVTRTDNGRPLLLPSKPAKPPKFLPLPPHLESLHLCSSSIRPGLLKKTFLSEEGKRIRRISVSGRVVDQTLVSDILPSLPALKKLQMDVEDSKLELSFSRFCRLECLDLRFVYRSHSNAAFSAMLEEIVSLEQLQELIIAAQQEVDILSMEAFSLKNLRLLALSFVPPSADFGRILTCQHLTHLDLSFGSQHQDGRPALLIAQLASLEWLRLIFPYLAKGTVELWTSKLTRLTSLALENPLGDGLHEIGTPWPSLKSLELINVPAIDYQLSCLVNLAVLRFSWCEITSVTWSEVFLLENLIGLACVMCSVNCENMFEHLSRLRRLKFASFDQNMTSEHNLECTMRKSKCPWPLSVRELSPEDQLFIIQLH